MKKTIDGVLVVEGHNDASYISSFVNAIIVTTNGYDIPKEEMDFLINLPTNKKIYILTDPDEAGEEIRNRLNKHLPHTQNLNVDISKCQKNHKHGVAECDKDELLKILTPLASKQINNKKISTSDLLKLGVDSKNKRQFVCEKLHLGICNNKTFVNRINYLEISYQQIENIIKEYGN